MTSLHSQPCKHGMVYFCHALIRLLERENAQNLKQREQTNAHTHTYTCTHVQAERVERAWQCSERTCTQDATPARPECARHNRCTTVLLRASFGATHTHTHTRKSFGSSLAHFTEHHGPILAGLSCREATLNNRVLGEAVASWLAF